MLDLRIYYTDLNEIFFLRKLWLSPNLDSRIRGNDINVSFLALRALILFPCHPREKHDRSCLRGSRLNQSFLNRTIAQSECHLITISFLGKPKMNKIRIRLLFTEDNRVFVYFRCWSVSTGRMLFSRMFFRLIDFLISSWFDDFFLTTSIMVLSFWPLSYVLLLIPFTMPRRIITSKTLLAMVIPHIPHQPQMAAAAAPRGHAIRLRRLQPHR